MVNRNILLFSLSLFQAIVFHFPLASQPPGWTQTEAFDNRYFIENKGQFDFLNGYDTAKVLYAIKGNGVYILFTHGGILYRFSEIEDRASENRYTNQMRENKYKNARVHYRYIRMSWQNADPEASIEPSGKADFYITCADPGHPNSPGFTACAFKKIRYKNVYPGIDVDYFFIDRRDGFKYNIILHPGADAAIISQVYDMGSKLKTGTSGELQIHRKNFIITDTKPIEANGKYDLHYRVEGNRVSLNGLPAGKTRETTLIDPFTVVPGFSNSQKAYDVDYDYQGNVYVYGGVENGMTPYELIKLNSTGNIVWKHFSFQSHAPPFYYGDFTVNRCTGSVFISEGAGNMTTGAAIEKLKVNGAMDLFYPGNPKHDEIWRIGNFNCSNRLIMGNQGRQNGSNQISTLDTLFQNFNSYNTLPPGGGPPRGNDAIAVCEDKQGIFFIHYVISLFISPNDNFIASGRFNNPFLLYYVNRSGHLFQELSAVKYNNDTNNNIYANGFNGLCVNDSFLYTYDGATIRQWDKTKGILQRDVNTSVRDTFWWGGIDVDSCNILFAGVEKTIQVFDVNLLKINTLYLNDTIYDLRIYKDKLFACGKGFVSQLDIPLPDCIPDSIHTTSFLEVPNVFSPNGDNINERFTFKMKGIESIDVRIYNRWGLIVAELTDPEDSWDGKNIQGNPVPNGTYYYTIKAKGVDGKGYDLNGFLTLLR